MLPGRSSRRLQIRLQGLRRSVASGSYVPRQFPSLPPVASKSARTQMTSVKVDYSAYSHADLLRRVHDLEAQLRNLNSSAHARSHPSPAAKKKPKKAPKPFDPSRYNTRFIALKFAYLGGNYNGFEHHANNTTPLPTIEETLWKALRKTRLIFPDFGGRSEEEVCWDGLEYSKCGRTDRGVSAFGQVIALKVRSNQPKAAPRQADGAVDGQDTVEVTQPQWDPVRDELPYIQLLNRVLPPDIRVLAWCPSPAPDFSARFSCKERRYRYFFTNPAYSTAPGSSEGCLDIAKMQEAAQKYEGLHDFRNVCKVDPSKQISNFERRIFHAGVHAVQPQDISNSGKKPSLYYFEVRGSAFLWHQVRHLVAVLFLVGQGYEQPSIVDQLLDVQSCPGRPVYEMADDRPLVLWDCIFPAAKSLPGPDHIPVGLSTSGYEDNIEWVYVGDEAGGRDPAKRVVPGLGDGKYGRNGIMDELWALWRKRRIDEVLAGSLMDVVAQLGGGKDALANGHAAPPNDAMSLASGVGIVSSSDRVFDGSDCPRTVGKYIPVMEREKMETPDVVNARYAARKGLPPKMGGDAANVDADMDE